jgi:uncharacterized protein YcfJ
VGPYVPRIVVVVGDAVGDVIGAMVGAMVGALVGGVVVGEAVVVVGAAAVGAAVGETGAAVVGAAVMTRPRLHTKGLVTKRVLLISHAWSSQACSCIQLTTRQCWSPCQLSGC